MVWAAVSLRPAAAPAARALTMMVMGSMGMFLGDWVE